MPAGCLEWADQAAHAEINAEAELRKAHGLDGGSCVPYSCVSLGVCAGVFRSPRVAVRARPVDPAFKSHRACFFFVVVLARLAARIGTDLNIFLRSFRALTGLLWDLAVGELILQARAGALACFAAVARVHATAGLATEFPVGLVWCRDSCSAMLALFTCSGCGC